MTRVGSNNAGMKDRDETNGRWMGGLSGGNSVSAANNIPLLPSCSTQSHTLTHAKSNRHAAVRPAKPILAQDRVVHTPLIPLLLGDHKHGRVLNQRACSEISRSEHAPSTARTRQNLQKVRVDCRRLSAGFETVRVGGRLQLSGGQRCSSGGAPRARASNLWNNGCEVRSAQGARRGRAGRRGRHGQWCGW